MEWVDIDEEMGRLFSENEGHKATLLCDMIAEYKDLRLYRDDKGLMKFTSQEANVFADRLEFSANGESTIRVWPFVVIDPIGTKLYGSPPCFVIGEENEAGFGVKPREAWLEEMIQAELDEDIIARVKDWLSARPPINYKETT